MGADSAGVGLFSGWGVVNAGARTGATEVGAVDEGGVP